MLVTNRIFWNQLPDDLKKTIHTCVDDATEYTNERAKALNMEQLEKIRESGSVEIHKLSAQERKAWQEEMMEIYPEFYDVIGKQRIDKALELADN
jgi:C4-dicarboxylate-binding protein DctP